MILLRIPANPHNCAVCSMLGQRFADDEFGIRGFRIGDFVFILELDATDTGEGEDSDALWTSDPDRLH